jgi:hypothetical protein
MEIILLISAISGIACLSSISTCVRANMARAEEHADNVNIQVFEEEINKIQPDGTREQIIKHQVNYSNLSEGAISQEAHKFRNGLDNNVATQIARNGAVAIAAANVPISSLYNLDMFGQNMLIARDNFTFLDGHDNVANADALLIGESYEGNYDEING